jgi:hypothetical protein
MVLKGMKHETIQKTIDAEKKRGNIIVKGKGGRYFSVPGKDNVFSDFDLGPTSPSVLTDPAEREQQIKTTLDMAEQTGLSVPDTMDNLDVLHTEVEHLDKTWNEAKQDVLGAWNPSLWERIRRYFYTPPPLEGWDRSDKPLRTAGKLGAAALAEAASGLTLRTLDIASQQLGGEPTLAGTVAKRLDLERTPREEAQGALIRTLGEFKTLGIATGPLVKAIPARESLRIILHSGVTLGGAETVDQIVEKITTGKPFDIEGIHFDAGLGVLFGTGVVGAQKFAQFIKGIRQTKALATTTKGVSGTSREAMRAEVNAALKNREANPAEWERIKLKYVHAGMTPAERQAGMKARGAGQPTQTTIPISKTAVKPETTAIVRRYNNAIQAAQAKGDAGAIEAVKTMAQVEVRNLEKAVESDISSAVQELKAKAPTEPTEPTVTPTEEIAAPEGAKGVQQSARAFLLKQGYSQESLNQYDESTIEAFAESKGWIPPVSGLPESQTAAGYAVSRLLNPVGDAVPMDIDVLDMAVQQLEERLEQGELTAERLRSSEIWQHQDFEGSARLNAAFEHDPEGLISALRELVDRKMAVTPTEEIAAPEGAEGVEQPWKMTKREFVGETLPEPDATEEVWREYSNRRREWTESTMAAVSEGKLTPEQAEKRGLPYSVQSWVELPETLYHTTTAKTAVSKEGLKSRRALEQERGLGLGGGESEAISFTTEKKIAEDIKRGLLEARKVARGDITIEEMLKQAEEGTSANRAWLTDVMRGYVVGWKKGTPYPPAVDRLMRGVQYSYKTLGATKEKMEGWTPVGGELGNNKFTQWERPSTEAELREDRFEFYKRWSAHREVAGGAFDPLFFLSEVEGLSQVDPAEIAVVKFHPQPGAMGQRKSAMGEYITFSGKAVTPAAPEGAEGVTPAVPPSNLVVYHGSPEGKLTKIDPTWHTAQWKEGIGFYVTENPEVAQGYAEGATRGRKTEGKVNEFTLDLSLERVLDFDAPAQNNIDLWEKVARRTGLP